jgi:hypothetical protein
MRPGARSAITIGLLAMAFAAAGCGSGGGSAPPPPEECLESWNSDEIAERFGRHIYNSHETRRTQVAVLEPVDPNPNIPSTGGCAAIFAIPETDIEYGIAGLVETDLGWASMQELARTDPAALERIQSEASDGANATLFPDGSLAPD